MPERLAHRLLSKRKLSADRLYSHSTSLYFRGILSAGIENIFQANEEVTILEAGTGVYNPTSAPLLLAGAKRLILLEPFIGKALDTELLATRFNRLIEVAETDAEFPLEIRQQPGKLRASSDSLPPGVELCERLWEDTGLPDASIDAIFSVSVLEHLRDPEAVLKECARILRPGAWMINSVDMRDHYFRYPYEMLKYSPATWNCLTTRVGGAGYQNRWRLPRWLRKLERAGFETEVIVLKDQADLLAKEKSYFHQDFKSYSDDDLRITAALLVSRRVT